MKATQEALDDFNRLKKSLGFQLFLSVLQEQVESQDSIILSEVTKFDGLLPQQQAIGAKRALSYLLNNYVELVNQKQ